MPNIRGAQYTDYVSCDFITAGELLAGYEYDEDGVIGLTHLEANGMDIYLLAVEVPAAIKQIEQRLDANFMRIAPLIQAEQRADDHYDARQA